MMKKAQYCDWCGEFVGEFVRARGRCNLVREA